MKYRISAMLALCTLAAACARPEPAPVTGWNGGGSSTAVRVERGDTLFGIAKRYGEPVRLIIAANHLVPPYRLDPGQTLIIPAADAPMPEEAGYAANPPPPSPVHRRARVAEAAGRASPAAGAGEAARIDSDEVPPSDRPAPPAVQAAARKPPAQIHPAAAVIPPRAAVAPGDIGAHGFIWPVRGHIVEGYGAGRNGTQNDGINIAARAGAPVYAAAAGEVVYVGNELRGYGNLVLIKHEGGYLTAYAHNSALLVHKGEHVARGQPIARVGRTGQVGEPQLHFEIRQGRKPVDPMQYLAPEQQASIGE